MKVRRLDFSDVALYAVTPSIKDTQKIIDVSKELLAGGVDAIQLRNKVLSDKEFYELGKLLKVECEKSDALLIIDNRADITLALDAHGVHIGHEDLPIKFVRELIGHRKLIGRSAHSLPEAIQAQRDGADYVSCGPLWATPTKPDYKAVGTGLIDFYKAAMKVPFVAIGGIDNNNIDEVVQKGAKTIALVRALYEAPNPKAAAEKFKEKILKNWEESWVLN